MEVPCNKPSWSVVCWSWSSARFLHAPAVDTIEGQPRTATAKRWFAIERWIPKIPSRISTQTDGGRIRTAVPPRAGDRYGSVSLMVSCRPGQGNRPSSRSGRSSRNVGTLHNARGRPCRWAAHTSTRSPSYRRTYRDERIPDPDGGRGNREPDARYSCISRTNDSSGRTVYPYRSLRMRFIPARMNVTPLVSVIGIESIRIP